MNLRLKPSRVFDYGPQGWSPTFPELLPPIKIPGTRGYENDLGDISPECGVVKRDGCRETVVRSQESVVSEIRTAFSSEEFCFEFWISGFRVLYEPKVAPLR
jgi:hypothetical protein